MYVFKNYTVYCTDLRTNYRKTVKDYVMAHDSSPFLVLLRFLASLAELISEMWLKFSNISGICSR